MSKDFIIRPIEKNDLEKADALFEASLMANPEGFRAKPSESNLDFMARLMGCRAKGTGDFLVGMLDRDIVAVGGLDPEGMRRTNPDGSFPELARVHVASAYQKRGYGTAIIQAVTHMAGNMGYERMQLHVTKSQKTAIRLYETMGWVKFHEEVFTGTDGKFYPTLCYKLGLPESLYAQGFQKQCSSI
jgi:ribosomal protein S18 acetylase RimI-like enzyme